MVYNNGFGVKIITDSDQDKLKRGDYNYVALQNNTEYKLQLVNDRSTDAIAEVFIEDKQVGTWFVPANEDIIIDRPANVARKFTFFRETDPRVINAGVALGESSNGLIRVVFYPKKQQYIVIRSSPNVMLPSSPSGVTSTGLVSPRITQQPLPSQSLQFPVLPTLIAPLASTSTLPSSIAPQQLQSLTSTQQSSMALKETRSGSGFQLTPISSYSPRSTMYQSGATVLGRDSYQTFGTMKRFSNDEIDWSNKTEIIIRLVVKPNVYISTVQSSSPNQWSREFVAIKTYNQPIPPRIDYTPSF